jgi:hypothetical protein
MQVRVYYADVTYEVHLGQLVTVWTRHISPGEQASLAPASAPLFTSIFPERERSCHISLLNSEEEEILCRRPFGCTDEEVLPGLMTIKNFIDGGYGVEDCKLLVCVKSIGPRKKGKAAFHFVGIAVVLTIPAQSLQKRGICSNS